ncbi:MAG: YbaB/EbfC family nucleoid-associated protein [Acidobacteriota bacterium]
MNMKNLLQQAQEMQERMQKDLSEIEVSASVGGDLVTATMDGHKNVLSIKLAQEVVDPTDVEMLQDLIVAAVNQAARRVDERVQSAFGSHAASLPRIF